MCDFSLMHVKSRPAQVGDKLKTKNFGTGTSGFCAIDDEDCAVCVQPGTEIAFDEPFKTSSSFTGDAKEHSTVAIFRQINKESVCTHHDALETPEGKQVLLTQLRPDQMATVLQLPAAPKTEEEAQDQKRLEIVA